jgi:hypothetical protein
MHPSPFKGRVKLTQRNLSLIRAHDRVVSELPRAKSDGGGERACGRYCSEVLWLWLWDWVTDADGRQSGHGETRLGADGRAGVACAVGAGWVEGLGGGAAVGGVPVVDCRGFGLDFLCGGLGLGYGLGWDGGGDAYGMEVAVGSRGGCRV